MTHSHGKLLKAHLHTEDREGLRRSLDSLGSVVRVASDDLARQTRAFRRGPVRQAVHIVTDGAASISRQDAQEEGISLLDSYVNMGGKSLPESYLDADQLYGAMSRGVRVSTSQASVFERHQQYEKLLSLYPQALYLCVGSVYTGNHGVVSAWKEASDPDGRLVVIDSGLASGKLGLVVLETARCATRVTTGRDVVSFARQALLVCEEYLFLDRLQYLAAGGRISRTSSFFGDLLHMKPVITPTARGAEKVAVLRSQDEQVQFLLDRLKSLPAGRRPRNFLLQYTDTRALVERTVCPELRSLFPEASFRIGSSVEHVGSSHGPGYLGCGVFAPRPRRGAPPVKDVDSVERDSSPG